MDLHKVAKNVNYEEKDTFPSKNEKRVLQLY